MYYSANPEIDAAHHEAELEVRQSLVLLQEARAVHALTQSMLTAMQCENLDCTIAGTFKMYPSEAIYTVAMDGDGGAAIDAAICYLAKSTDPVAREHAEKIARMFAVLHIGDIK